MATYQHCSRSAHVRETAAAARPRALILPSTVSIMRPPRVMVQDENKILPNQAFPLKKPSLVPPPTLKRPAFAKKDVLAEVTNSKQRPQPQPQLKQGPPTKTAPALVLPVPIPTQTPAPTLVRSRPQSMKPAPPTQRPVPSLTRASSASTALSSRRQANSFAQGTIRPVSTKVDSSSIRKSFAPTGASSRHGARSTALATSIDQDCGVPKKPAAPKMNAIKRHRSQIPLMERSSTHTILRPAVAQNPSKTHQGPLIPAVPMLDSHMYLDIDMEAVLPGETHRHAVTADMDIDILLDQDEYDPDPTLVSEYQEAIFSYKREMEIKLMPNPNYMTKQSALTWHYRVQLIEWLVQVHDRFNLLQETMHLCVNYLDRFLSKMIIRIDQLQLAGTVALLLASKYEEIQSPAIEMLAYLGGNVHSPARIREAEIGMLRALNYDMGAPGPMSFLRRISRADNYDMDIRTLAKYIIDITLCDHRFIGLPSSMIAAVGYRTSMLLLFRGKWTEDHESLSGYTQSMLTAAINVLLTMLEQPVQTHQALFAKYQDERHMGSSSYVQSLGVAQLRSLHLQTLFR